MTKQQVHTFSFTLLIVPLDFCLESVLVALLVSLDFRLIGIGDFEISNSGIGTSRSTGWFKSSNLLTPVLLVAFLESKLPRFLFGNFGIPVDSVKE